MNFVDMVIDKKLYKKFSLTEGTSFEHTSKHYANWEVTTEVGKSEAWSEEIRVGKFTPITSGDINIVGICRLNQSIAKRGYIYFKLYENDILVESYSASLSFDIDDRPDKDHASGEKPINIKAFNDYKITAQFKVVPNPAEGSYFTSVATYTGGAKYRINGNVADDGSRYIIEKG